MDTQNTPVHIRLWNHDFWLLAFANLLLTMAVYMQMMYIPEWAKQYGGYPDVLVWSLVGYSIGLFTLGGFCSFLVQKYRRNRVCLQSFIVLMALLASPAYLSPFFRLNAGWAFPLLRLATGAFFGLSQMVLASTLVIDCSESYQRTEANYATSWFYRLALPLGPITAIMLSRFTDIQVATWVAVALVASAFLLLLFVKFPFKSPEDNLQWFSLDRFLLPRAWILFLQLMIVTLVLGMVISVFFTCAHFYAWLLLGFLFALLAGKFVFLKTELNVDTILGLLLMSGALLLMLTSGKDMMSLVSVFLGLGAGLIGSRFLLMFIKISEHCQRGTSQSTYFLAWETGLALGLCLGFILIADHETCENVDGLSSVCILALALTIISLLMYVGFTHKWYLKHKNR